MVGMCTRLAIERASAETPHLKRGASDFYPSGAGHPGQDGVNGKPEELLVWGSLSSANFAKRSSVHLLSPSVGAHSIPFLAWRRCCLAALSSQSPRP